ncbi:alpha-hydroxy-acid oxidizing protein [Sulfitobacter sp. NFXS29]
MNDYYNRARAGMSPRNRAYFLAVAGGGQTLSANETAFQQAQVTPRMLRDLRSGSTEVSLLRQKLAAPFLIAPLPITDCCMTQARAQLPARPRPSRSRWC